MKTSYLFFFICCLSFTACQQNPTTYVPKGLTKLSNEEMIERAKNGNLGKAEEVILKNEKGEIISRESLDLLLE